MPTTPPNARRRWGLGRVAPALLLAVAALDAAARFLPMQPFAFRAWEVAGRFAPPGMAFAPAGAWRLEREHGDLAQLGNRPARREPRRTSFTTDALGFRNPPRLGERGGIGAVVLGDSFAAGAGASDEDTLAAALGAMTGCAVYNAAGLPEFASTLDPGPVVRLARRLGMATGLVVVEYSGQGWIERRPSPARDRLAAWPAAARAYGRIRGWLTVSPLQMLAQRAVRALEDDRVLPNARGANAAERTLANGAPMLFRPADLAAAPAGAPARAERWAAFRDGLRAAGLDLLVLLVPDKYAVYAALLGAGAVAPAPARFADLEATLVSARVAAVNLTPVFQAEAARAFPDGRYLYWRDDTHWNPEGIRVAAAEVARAWGRRAGACAR